MRSTKIVLAVFGALLVAVGSTASNSGLVAAVVDGPLTDPARAQQQADRVDPPEPVDPAVPLPNRPRVFMALHGNNQIANDPGLDSQWSFVRENVDGIWGNPVGMDAGEIGRLINKVDTRQFIAEAALPPAGTPIEVPTFEYVEQQNPGLFLRREGVAFYTDQPSLWDGRSVAGIRGKIPLVGPQRKPLYDHVYTGWQPYNFLNTDSRSIRPGSSADRALDDGDGLFVECPSRACAEPQNGLGPNFRAAIQEAHANGRPFIWFASRPPSLTGSGWLQQFQMTYNSIRDAGLWRRGDIVMVISYDGSYPIVPETVDGQPADTIMGSIYWALKQ